MEDLNKASDYKLTDIYHSKPQKKQKRRRFLSAMVESEEEQFIQDSSLDNCTNPNKIQNYLNTTLREFNTAEKKPTFFQIKRKNQHCNPLRLNPMHYSKHSFWFLKFNSPLRKLLFSLVFSSYFDIFFFVSIITEFVLSILAVQYQFIALNTLRTIFFSLYLVEMLVKVGAFGFHSAEKAYLAFPWSKIEFAYILLSSFRFVPGLVDSDFLKLANVIKPISLINFFPSVNKTLKIIILSFNKIMGILLFLLVSLAFFSAVGQSFLAGKLTYMCFEGNTPSAGTLSLVEPLTLCQTKQDCYSGTCVSMARIFNEGVHFIAPTQSIHPESLSRRLHYNHSNFNTFLASFLTVFQSVTLKKWVNIMGMYQEAYDFYFATLYFLTVVIFSKFFVLNFIIGVMIYTYEKNESKSENDSNIGEIKGLDEQTKSQFFNLYHDLKARSLSYLREIRQMLASFSFIDKFRPVIQRHRSNRLFYWAFVLYKQRVFSFTVDICICANLVTLLLDTLEDEHSVFFYNCNIIFICVFLLETILRLVAFGFRQFMSKPVYIFDLAVVCVSVVEIFLSRDSSMLSTLRGLRALRMLKFLMKFKIIELTVQSMLEAIKKIVNYVMMIVIFISVFSLVGNEIYKGKLRRDKEPTKINFDTYLNSLFAVFNITIGDGWPDIFYDCLESRVSAFFTYFFFILMIIILHIVILNLFSAFFIISFSQSRKKYADTQMRLGVITELKSPLISR